MIKQNKIEIHDPEVRKGNIIYCNFKCSGKVGEYFTENTFYLHHSENVEKVPKSILIIPVLANIAPVAWIAGADIYVNEIDEEFLEALETIKNSFKSMYPKHCFNGTIIFNTKRINKDYGKEKCGLFFSGGVDSLTSYIRNRKEQPILITVWGADISLKKREFWNKVKNDITQFTNDHNIKTVYLKSNFRSFLNEKNLYKFSRNGLKNWWVSVQHGLGLVGLSAPLTYKKGIKKVYFASTPLISKDNKLSFVAWGSHPSIENNLKWGETEVELDGIELNRFEKLGIIANYLRDLNYDLKLRVCWKSNNESNCSTCEKCARTMAMLLIKGLNPSKHGFNMDNSLLQRMKSNKRFFVKINKHQWTMIQHKISEIIHNVDPEYYDFCNWILKVEFKRK